jgi:1,4-alpha-glucan branching enzyme
MTQITESGTVEFRFFRPGVYGVKLAGEFTGWAARPVEMRDAGDGWWIAELNLAPGEYRFRYIADGQWYTDFASHGIEASKYGWNSVLLIQHASEPAIKLAIGRQNKLARSAA